MGACIENTKAFMESKSMVYRSADDNKALFVGIGGLDNAPNIDILVIFDDNDKGVTLRIMNLCKWQDNNINAKMFKTCSDANARFRWVKFFVDKEHNSLSVQDDAVLQPETAGDEVYELIMRMANIVDEAYPEFMKAMWS